MGAILRKYGTATTILFPLIDYSTTDFETAATFASGDTQISKDEGAFANTSNNPAHEGNGIYSLALTATEMQAARIVVTIIDQDASKVWQDQSVVIETYGNASGQHEFDLDDADGIWVAAAESTLTYQQVVRVMLAALAGKSSGGGTVTHNFRDYADAKNRITATVDSSGNRTAITVDGT